MLLLFAVTLNAQVTITTVVTPPYTSNFESYAEKVRVTVISPATGSLRLNMTIKGDNGITIKTLEIGTTPITHNVPLLVPSDYLDDVFNISYLSVSGISASELSVKGLPAGTYQICFAATVYNSDVTFNANSCSSMFTVSLVQPPRILQPLCGSEQFKGGIQNILFSWAPSPGAPRWTQYTLRIVEIRDSTLSPAQALLSGTRPPFFEEEVSGTSYLYSPKDPPLEKGCRYAFEVIARDEETNTRFNNNGHSEMCYFKYGKEDKFKAPVLTQQGSKRKTVSPATKQFIPGIFFAPANISGTLYYQYAGPNLPTTISLANLNGQAVVNQPNAINIPAPAGENKSSNVKIVNISGQNLSLTKTTNVSYSASTNTVPKTVSSFNPLQNLSFLRNDVRDKAHSFPLANMPFSLVVKYMIFESSTGKMLVLSAYDLNVNALPAKLQGLKPDQVLASGFTDASGNFDQTFLLQDTLGMVATNFTFTSGSGEFKYTHTGILFRVVRLIVGSSHYCSPAQDMIVQPGESVSYDDLYALVRNYGLKVATVKANSSSDAFDGPFEGLDVYILRKDNIADVPSDEGFPVADSASLHELKGLKVIAHTKTKKDGTASFMHLVKNLNGYDKYYIYVNSNSSESFAFKSLVYEYSNTVPPPESIYIVVPENAVYNNEYVYKDDFSKTVNLIAMPPIVYGIVTLISGTKDVKATNEGLLAADASVTLSIGFGPFSVAQIKAQTNAEGRFSFSVPMADNQKTFKLSASLDGYKSACVDVNNGAALLKGQKKEVDGLTLMTKALFSGKIVDSETGTGVICKVSVEGGLSINSSQSLLSIKPEQPQISFTLQSADMNIINNMASKFVVPGQTKVTNAVFINTGTAPSVNVTNLAAPAKTATPAMAKANTGVSQAVVQGSFGPSYFALPAPSGEQSIIVDPDDNVNYFSDTLKVNLAEGNNTAVIKAIKKMHRIKVIVKSEKQQPLPVMTAPTSVVNNAADAANASNISNATNVSNVSNLSNVSNVANLSNNQATQHSNNALLQPSHTTISSLTTGGIINAKVRVADNRTDYVLTDMTGAAYLEFEGSGTFTIEVVPPDNQDFESGTLSFENADFNKTFKTETIELKKAAHISGTVTFNGSGVKGATVSLNYSGKDITVTTGDDGKYTLRNVPLGESLKVNAAMSGYIGATNELTVSSNAQDGVDFVLTKSTEFDYSKMFGFQIQVTDESKDGGKHKISGYFTGLPVNGQIETEEADEKIYFKDLEITQGTVTGQDNMPYPVPVDQLVKSDANTVSLKLNGTFFGTLEDKDGIKITKGATDNSGYIKGKVFMKTGSSFQSNDATINSDIYLMSATSDQTPKDFNVIASDGTKPFSNNVIPLFNQNGKDIPYTLFGYNAVAKASSSRIDGAVVKFNTVLHTNLANTGTADLAVELGDVEVTPTMVKPLSKTSTITMPLEQWNLKATSWSLNSTGFKLSKGEIVTHMANVGFTNMEIKSTELAGGTFDLQKLNIRNIATLNVTGNASLFCQDGHWFLAITPNGGDCGYIDGLPGMPQTQKIKVTSVYLKSDKTGIFALNLEPMKLYSIVDFTPDNMHVYDDRIEFQGTINLNIPDIPARTSLLTYRRNGSEVNLALQPFTFDFTTKGVDLKFSIDPSSLSSSGLTAKGTLSEPGLYSVNVQMNHNISKTEIVDIPGQAFPIDKSGNKKLNNFDGEMHVNSGSWTNFAFNGDLTGANGATSHMAFIVNGDVTADGQSVQMDKVSTPFGDLKLTFDFEHSRVIGILEIEQELAGTGFIKGSAESVIDKDGWYFCAGGKITMKGNPYIKEASTAMLFGDYPALNDPFITQTFANYSYSHALPTAFQGHIAGFYIDGSAEFPIPYIPNIDINLVVVSGHVSVSAGGDFSLGMNYSDGVGTVYTGAALFLNASAGIGGSIGIACAGASFGVNVEIASHGQLKTNGDWFLDGSATLTLSGRAYAGCGCCDSDCDGYYICPCFSDDWSGSISLGLLTHMGNDDNYIKINW